LRIAIIGSRGYPYVYSGYETFVAELSEALHARSHDVTVYAHRELFQLRPPRVNGIRVVYVPGVSWKSFSQLTHGALSVLHSLYDRPDVMLFVNAANGPFGIVTTLLGRPTVINVDGLEWLRPKWRGLGQVYFRWAARMAARWFDRVVTDAARMRDVYQQEFGVTATTIPYGARQPATVDPKALSQWGLHDQQYYLVVGRLIPDNNADVIIDGFRKCATDRKLAIVGDVRYVDRYASALRSIKDERIVWCGYVRDRIVLDTLYSSCYAYLHGHGYGGTNPTLLEAMAAGRAVLAIDNPFSRETLGDGGTGWFWQRDAGEVTRCLEFAEAHPAALSDAGQRARTRVLREYTWKRVVDEYEAVFEDLARDGARNP
jgi:glycosyltransferase involved in cell wall biosynthesis